MRMASSSTMLRSVSLAAVLLAMGAPASPWADDCAARGLGVLGAKESDPILTLPSQAMDGVLEASIREGSNLHIVADILERTGDAVAPPGRAYELLNIAARSQWFLGEFMPSFSTLGPSYTRFSGTREFLVQGRVLKELALRAGDILMAPDGGTVRWNVFWGDGKMAENAKFALAGHWDDRESLGAMGMRIDAMIMSVSNHVLKHMAVNADSRIAERIVDAGLDKSLRFSDSGEAHAFFMELLRNGRPGEATDAFLARAAGSLAPKQAAALVEPAREAGAGPDVAMALLRSSGDAAPGRWPRLGGG